ncbi:hypothetical protein STSO111631_20435 [Stackebrandtia soli]
MEYTRARPFVRPTQSVFGGATASFDGVLPTMNSPDAAEPLIATITAVNSAHKRLRMVPPTMAAKPGAPAPPHGHSP